MAKQHNRSDLLHIAILTSLMAFTANIACNAHGNRHESKRRFFATENAGAAAHRKAFAAATLEENSGTPLPLIRITPDGALFLHQPMKVIIARAYLPAVYQFSDMIEGGPDWLKSTPYDFKAVVKQDDFARWQEERLDQGSLDSGKLLQQMLAELLGRCCRLRVHTVQSTVPGYEITQTAGESCSTFKSSYRTSSSNTRSSAVPIADGGSMSVGDDQEGNVVKEYRNTSMNAFASDLTLSLQVPVRNETNRSGHYDFSIAVPPQRRPFTYFSPEMKRSLASLCLELKSQSIPVNKVVIDSISEP